MGLEKINPEGLHVPVDNLYAHIVRSEGRVRYRIGGQVPLDSKGDNIATGDMAGQIRSCYEQVDLALKVVGLGWSNVEHIYTFTTDMDEYMKEELAIARGYLGDHPPASTLVQVARLVDPEWMVEVQVDAVDDS